MVHRIPTHFCTPLVVPWRPCKAAISLSPRFLCEADFKSNRSVILGQAHLFHEIPNYITIRLSFTGHPITIPPHLCIHCLENTEVRQSTFLCVQGKQECYRKGPKLTPTQKRRLWHNQKYRKRREVSDSADGARSSYAREALASRLLNAKSYMQYDGKEELLPHALFSHLWLKSLLPPRLRGLWRKNIFKWNLSLSLYTKSIF